MPNAEREQAGPTGAVGGMSISNIKLLNSCSTLSTTQIYTNVDSVRQVFCVQKDYATRLDVFYLWTLEERNREITERGLI